MDLQKEQQQHATVFSIKTLNQKHKKFINALKTSEFSFRVGVAPLLSKDFDHN